MSKWVSLITTGCHSMNQSHRLMPEIACSRLCLVLREWIHPILLPQQSHHNRGAQFKLNTRRLYITEYLSREKLNQWKMENVLKWVPRCFSSLICIVCLHIQVVEKEALALKKEYGTPRLTTLEAESDREINISKQCRGRVAPKNGIRMKRGVYIEISLSLANSTPIRSCLTCRIGVT